MKPKNLSEVKSQDEFLEYLIDNYYRLLGEGDRFDKFVSWFNTGKDHVLIVINQIDTIICEEFKNRSCTKWEVSLSAYKDKIKSLRNKPSFEDHPDAKCFVQNAGGCWYKNIKTSHVIAEEVRGSWTAKSLIGSSYNWALVNQGKVIGDWKQTFEKAPEKQNDTRLQDVLASAIQEDFKYVENESHIISYDSSKVIFKLGETLHISGYTLDNGAVQLDMIAEPVLEVISNQEKVIAKLQKDMEELKTKLERIKQSLS